MRASNASLTKGYQLSLPDFGPLHDAVSTLAHGANKEERGAIYTRQEVVEFILDLVGYTIERPLHQMRLLEPSVGEGDFLIPAVRRLITAYKLQSDKSDYADARLSNAVLAVELHDATYRNVYNKIQAVLIEEGIGPAEATALASSWLVADDFLLAEVAERFDFVVGNPPYVRQELIPDVLLKEYRARYHTIYDRADLYIPFIERSLSLLGEDGVLGFICADRWMKNRYGGPLRKFVSDNFHLRFYIDMVDRQAFMTDVNAYPAVTVFSRKKEKITKVARCPNIVSEELGRLASILTSENSAINDTHVAQVEGVTASSEPWILEAPDQLTLVRRLESKFPSLEEAKCKVGIGVATGLDKVFIGTFDDLDVEDDRKLPLVMTRDLRGDTVAWGGLGVINPFSNDGSLVDLERYPRLKKYLQVHKSTILKRHVSLKNPNNWYRTIDRIYPEIASQPKLLIPDIKGEAHIIYENGRFYPHHNLYYITSKSWDLWALKAVLQSGIARLFVSIYSTKMRGGYLRFQAQYLRRIRIPFWEEVDDELKQELHKAVRLGDYVTSKTVVFKIFGLSETERRAIGEMGE